MTPYQQLWGVTEGAVKDAFNMHPDYLTPKGRQSAVASVTKRATGTVMSFAVAAARGGETPADTDGRKVSSVPSMGEANCEVSPDPHCRIGKVTVKRRPTFSRSITSARKIVANDNRSKAAAREAVDAFNATTEQLIAEQVAKGGPVPRYFAKQGGSLLKSVKG